MSESLSILTKIFLLRHDLEVFSRQSFVSLLQVCSRLSQLEDLVLLLASIATSYCCCENLLPFSMITLSRQSFFCRDSILCISSNSYVIKSIIMSQHSFMAASSSWCLNQSFHVATVSLFRLCCNTVLYYLHFYRDPESSIMIEACCH